MNVNTDLGPQIVTGAFTIGAVMLTLVAGWLNDWRRERREQARRWDKELRELCSALLLADSQYVNSFANGSTKEKADAFLRLVLELRLIAEEELAQTAYLLWLTALQYERQYKTPDRKKAAEQHQTAARHFIDATRAVFGHQELRLTVPEGRPDWSL